MRGKTEWLGKTYGETRWADIGGRVYKLRKNRERPVGNEEARKETEKCKITSDLDNRTMVNTWRISHAQTARETN